MNNFAPVLIITLNRYEHFIRCIESLSVCTYSDKTDLFIALDFPLKDSHWDGYKKINGYLDKITGFKTINIIKRSENFGVIKNFEDATKEIFQKFDRYIVSEDDNIFSPNFLDYINKGLYLYNDRKDVFAINGYNYPVKMPSNYKKNVYLWKGQSGWGYGIWRDRLPDLDYSVEKNVKIVQAFLSEFRNVRKVEKFAGHYFPSLLKMVIFNRMIGDALINMTLIKNNMVCVFPAISKVRNFGHDGSGIHGGSLPENNIFSLQEIDTSNEFDFDEEIELENRDIYKTLKNHFRRTGKKEIKTLFMYMKFLIKYKWFNRE
ncbi:MAG: hypothetical protein Q7W13_06275 [Bacteroidia bacterium]|nr:hypothetical protein [Bacteroidia bacterium]